MRLYFAYGSNMWVTQMSKRCPQSRKIGKAVLSGYRWIISARGYANVVVSEQDDVYGVIYAITPSDEQLLDKHEGVSSGAYLKCVLEVVQSQMSMECLVYVDPVTREGSPDTEYIVRINKGLADADLPEKYVAKYIRRFIPA